jgi:plastocyanin
MHKRTILLATLFASLSACSSHEATTAPQPTAGNAAVSAEDNFFSPAPVTISRGAAVNWTWRGGNLHTVTFDDGPSSAVQQTGSYTRTFQAAGVYKYHCLIHGLPMSGTITVQ